MTKQEIAFVSGATGFIGRHLVDRLEVNGVKVNALVRNSEQESFTSNVAVFEGDIFDQEVIREAIKDVDVVFHLVGLTHNLSGKDNKKHYFEVNVEGTRNILRACIGFNVQHFIYSSSIKAMAEESRDTLDETFEPIPSTPYGESKLAAEKLVVEYGKRHGFMTTLLRLPLVYGPGNKGNVYKMIEAVDKGRFILMGKGSSRRSMAYVGNVVEAALAVVGREEADGKVYIVKDEIDYTVRELYEAIAKGLGKRPLPYYLPMGLATGIARLGDIGGRFIGNSLPFNSEVLRKLTEPLTFSSSRIREEIGFKAKYNLYKTIGETIDWYRDNKHFKSL